MNPIYNPESCSHCIYICSPFMKVDVYICTAPHPFKDSFHVLVRCSNDGPDYFTLYMPKKNIDIQNFETSNLTERDRFFAALLRDETFMICAGLNDTQWGNKMNGLNLPKEVHNEN